MNKMEVTALIQDFTKKMPVSIMGLCYLMEKGRETVKETSEEEYLAAVDQQIAEANARNHVWLLSRAVSVDLYHYAKRLAELDPIDLVTVLGQVYQSRYQDMMRDAEENENSSLEGKS